MVFETADTAPTVRIISRAADWDAIAADWERLAQASAAAAPPLQFAWLRTWWQIYGPAYATIQRAADGITGLRLFTLWRGSRLVGALPLYERRGATGVFAPVRLCFLSTGEDEWEETCPDYMNLLASPGEEDVCLQALDNALDTIEWDCLELPGVPQNSVLASAEGWKRRRRRCSITAADVCPIANLEGGFETYLQRLSPNSRERSRRLLREVEQNGGVFALATAHTMEAFFADLVDLHQERWIAQGHAGCFAAPRFTAFHRALLTQWIDGGQALIARLSIGGETVAVLYGFLSQSKFDFYQSGVKTEQRALRSPGHAAHLLLMRELSRRGVSRYDFLRGSSRYKAQLATEQVQLVTVEIWRSAMRARAHQTARRARAAVRHAIPSGLRRRLRGD